MTIPGYSLFHGDCLSALRSMPDESVDAVVCDPPYALNEGANSVGDRIVEALAKVGFPQLHDFDAKSLEGGELAFIPVDGSHLGDGSRAGRVEAPIRGPVGPVDLEYTVGCDLEVDQRAEAPGVGIADRNLPLEWHPEEDQFLGDFVLELGDLTSADLREMVGGRKPEAFPGGFAVPIVVPGPAGGDGLSRGRFPITLADEHVGLGDDALSDAESAAGVVTLPRTVNTLMLRCDLAGRPHELLATNRADQLATIGASHGARLVRARSRSSRLATMAEPHRVRVVVPTADGARSTHCFRIWVPINHGLSVKLPRGGFMGKSWDSMLPDPEIWAQALRVAKPGAVLLAFGSPRVAHRLACAIEDAGWQLWDTISNFHEPRTAEFVSSLTDDQRQAWDALTPGGGPLAWMHGQGFPKNKRTQLKPAWEPIICGRKPGPMMLNIDDCRIELNGDYKSQPNGRPSLTGLGDFYDPAKANKPDTVGRWPANVTLDDCAALMLDLQAPATGARAAVKPEHQQSPTTGTTYGDYAKRATSDRVDELAGASRFFYTAKASTREREEGCEHLALHDNVGTMAGDADGSLKTGSGNERNRTARNHHPTVKPLALMRWLVRLVTPPGGTVLDPFAGSGTTGVAAIHEGRSALLCELNPEYHPIIHARCDYAIRKAMKR